MIPPHWRRPLFLAGNALGLATVLFTWWRGDGGLFLLLAVLFLAALGEALFGFLEALRPTPYLGMLLAPLLLLHYSSVGDFRIRLACFVMLLYVLVISCWKPEPRIRLFPEAMPAGRAWLLSLLAFSLAAAALYAQGIHLSGDEPHYVMIAQSLVEDGDFDLKNNLENKTYFKYLPVEIPLHGMAHGGRYRSFHLPGVSFLLVPFFYLFHLLGGWIPASLYFRLCAALINSFFALGLFNVLKSLWPEKNDSALFLFYLTTFPLVFHAIHLFPELPAATLLIFAYLSSRGQCRKFLLPGLLLAGIPWFHFKYVIPMLILELSVMAGIWRRSAGSKDKIINLAYLLIPQAVSASLLAFYSKVLYGSFNPTTISPEKNFFSIPLLPKIETLLSFFLDQRDGLLVYAPVFLMLFLVFKKEIRSQIRDFSLLAAIFFSYILFHAFTTIRGAYSPAARPTLFVLWIMAVFLTAYFRQAGETGKTLFRFLAGLTCFATVWIFYYPLFLYQPVTREVSQRASSLLLFLGSRAVNLSSVFPSFLKKPNGDYLANWIWLAVLAAGILLYYARAPRRTIAPQTREMAKPARFIFPALGLPLLFFVCFIPHIQLQTRYSVAGLSFYNNSRNFTFRKELGGFKIRAGQDYDLFFDLNGSAAERLHMRLSNPNRVALRIKNGKKTLLAENQDTENHILVSLRTLQKFTLGEKNLVHLGLESKAGPGTVFFWLEFRR